MAERMNDDLADMSDASLAGIRRRGQEYVGYLLWVFAFIGVLWTINTVLALVERWAGLMHRLRAALGIAPALGGPDWSVISGTGLLVLLGLGLVLWAYARYRVAWTRRLRTVWGATPHAAYAKIVRLSPIASDAILRRKAEYVCALLRCPGWQQPAPIPSPDAQLDREAYEATANAVLREIEHDIAHRAITTGLVVGLNRNPLLDTLTIVASALELQLHILTRLGKRPSLWTWTELVQRAGASMFLNTYVTRDDAFSLTLAIRKAALGLEVAADAVQHTLADVDVDEVLGHTAIPGLAELAHAAAFGVTVGTSGLRSIGTFIEHAANELLQGVLAAGILYYHGMALAAECLALDAKHRSNPAMRRTIPQAMRMACAPAGRLVRDQVRGLRSLLRERRRQILTVAKENVTGSAGKIGDAAKGLAGRATKLFGKTR